MPDMDEYMEWADDLSYAGFRPEVIRHVFIDKTGGNPESIIFALVTYIMVGNNYEAKLAKSKSATRAREAAQKMRTWGISVSRDRSNPESVTLSRLALSHPGILLKLRFDMATKGIIPHPSFSTITPLVFCDLTLSSYSPVMDYHEKMAKVLNHAASNNGRLPMSDEEAVARMQGFAALGETNKASDPMMKVKGGDYSAYSMEEICTAYGYTA